MGKEGIIIHTRICEGCFSSNALQLSLSSCPLAAMVNIQTLFNEDKLHEMTQTTSRPTERPILILAPWVACSVNVSH